jgi:hypothetical protein
VTRWPHFIIIGAMKCATSTLHEQLARQRGLFMSTPKEPNFFSDDAQWSRGVEWYHSLFAAAPDNALCGESSTHYTKLPTHPATVERMREHLPAETRFIYVMRHPIDRLVSHYKHAWSQQTITGGLEDAIDEHPELIEYSRYSRQLDPYLQAFGAPRVLPVFFDRLGAAPQQDLERICAFIGYPARPRWIDDLPPQNVSGRRLQKTRLRCLLLNSPTLRALARHIIPTRVRRRIEERWTIRVNAELSPEAERKLATVFDEDLARLGQWLGLDLRCETFRQVARTAEPRWLECRRGRVA